jgi:ferredoxin
VGDHWCRHHGIRGSGRRPRGLPGLRPHHAGGVPSGGSAGPLCISGISAEKVGAEGWSLTRGGRHAPLRGRDTQPFICHRPMHGYVSAQRTRLGFLSSGPARFRNERAITECWRSSKVKTPRSNVIVLHSQPPRVAECSKRAPRSQGKTESSSAPTTCSDSVDRRRRLLRTIPPRRGEGPRPPAPTAYTPMAADCRVCGLCVVACPDGTFILVAGARNS